MNPIILAFNTCTLSNAGSWGNCLIQTITGGDLVLGGIILFIAYGIMMIRFGLPFETIYPVSIGLTFLLAITSGSVVMWGIFALAVIVAGGLMAYALFNYFRSW